MLLLLGVLEGKMSAAKLTPGSGKYARIEFRTRQLRFDESSASAHWTPHTTTPTPTPKKAGTEVTH